MTNSNELREQKEIKRGRKKEGEREIGHRRDKDKSRFFFIPKHDRGLNLKKREREKNRERDKDR